MTTEPGQDNDRADAHPFEDGINPPPGRARKERIMATIYECPTLPMDWVVELSDRLWIVPAIHHGWDKRSPFRGYRESLRPVPSCYLIGLGVGRDCDARVADH